MTTLEQDMLDGLWVPINYGLRFKVCRLLHDRLRTQQTAPRVFKTLADAQAECDSRNGRTARVVR